MYLTRVEAQGFKSFADRQRFDFGPGMTAIVGPNGSGKSNVSDAIRWALGEQAQRSLRARKTEDVIFHGSEQRRATGVAEVTLTLDNSEGWMPVDFAEVAVTRRAFRSGENEYLINGQRVRLLDVHDLFRRAQVGQNSYAMMTQGMVDRVLSMRPAERRELIEEAAHVAQHRVELNRAERRLGQTRDNLGHVRVLIQEVEPRIRQLERQSVRARRYRELDRELQEALGVYYESEIRRAREALTAARARHDQHAQAFAAARTELGTVEETLAAATARVATHRAELDRRQAEERRLSEEVLRLEQAAALAEQRLELLRQRAADLDGELALLAPPAEAAEDGQAALVALETRVSEARAAVAREREALTGADTAARAVLRDVAEAEARRARLATEREDLLARVEELRQEAARLADERAEALTRRDTLKAELAAYGRQVVAQRTDRARREARTQEARERRIHAEEALEAAQQARQQERDRAQAAYAEVDRLVARGELLASLEEQMPDAGQAAQAVLDAARADDPEEALAGVVGVVSRLLRVPDGLEPAIEAALAEHLSAIVVERTDDALAAVAYLHAQGAGQTTVYPLEDVPHQYPLNLFNERGVIGVASRLVRCDRRYRPLIDTLLGRVIVVESLPVARDMVTRGLGAVVTRDGVLLRPNGAIYGGRAGHGAEQFRLRRELEDLPGAVEQAEETARQAAAALARSEARVQEAQAAVQAARQAVDEADLARQQEERQTGERLRGQLASIASRMRVAHQALRVDIEQQAGRLQRLGERVATLDGEQADVGTQIERLRDRTTSVTAEREEAERRATEATRTLATAEAERDALEREIRQREERRRQAERQIAERRDQLAATRRELEDLDGTLQQTRTELATARVALTAAREAVAPEHGALAEVLEVERECGATRGDLQARLFAAEREMLGSDATLREAAVRVTQLEQEVADAGLELRADGTVHRVPRPDGDTSGDGASGDGAAGDGAAASADGATDERATAAGAPAAAEPDEHDTADAARLAPISGGAAVDPVALRDRISELRGEIRALGPVNLEAIEDLTEERERFDFLTTQVADLEAAEAELRKAIRDLRREIRVRFETTFTDVNARFGEYFTRFFGGGEARLNIVEPEGDDEDAEAGVEIEARPPGKRVALLAQLSGGERSMTSVALLFALLSVNPAPVCVLDEVDAALDEANVGRFVDTLQEMAARTQFIVITHNRATVEAAASIYGVSMGPDSTSRVLSIALEELPQAS